MNMHGMRYRFCIDIRLHSTPYSLRSNIYSTRTDQILTA